MSYKLYAVRIFTKRWPQAVAFYRDTLGLELTFENETLGWAQFDVGGPSLAVERCDAQAPESEALVGRFVGVSIAVEDIVQTYQILSDRGVEFVAPPEKQPWGGTLVDFRDLDDNVITLLG